MTESAVLQALVDASIRGLVIAAAVGLVLALLRARSGAAAHAAWTAVMLAMLALPIAPKWLPAIPVALPQAPSLAGAMDAAPVTAAPRVAPAVAASATQTGVARTDSPAVPAAINRVASVPEPPVSWWPRGALVVWLLVAGILLTRVVAGWVMASRLARRSRTIAGVLHESHAVATPVAVGVWSPRIVVPPAWHAWPADMRAAVLTHELAHIRRRDTLVGLLAHVNCAIFWFNPLTWWLERRIAAAAEQACDDEVVRQSGERARYAEWLVSMANATRLHGGRVAWQTAGIAGRRALGQRIDRVLDGKGTVRLGPARSLALLLLSAAIIVPGIACQRQPPPLRENAELAAEFNRERERRLEFDALKNLDRAGLAALEAQVAKNPDDLALTAKLIYFYRDHGQKLMSWDDMVAARRPHLLRLIEKHPESEYTWWPLPQRLDPDGWAKARALWMAHLASPNVTPKVLRRAARFFSISEKPVAEEILLRALKTDPSGPQPRVVNNVYYSPWMSQLGELYATAIVGSDDDRLGTVVRSASLEEANGAFATTAKKKLAESKDPALLRAAGSYLTQNVRTRTGKIGDQQITLAFDARALGESYLDRARELDPDSETTKRFETYRKRAANEEKLSALAKEKLGGWRRATPEAVAALSETDRIALLPRLAAEAIMWAEAAEHDANIKDDVGQQYAKARAFSEQALRLVDKLGAGVGTSELRVTGHMARGIVALRDGDRAAAVAHLKASTDGVDANVVVEDFLWSRLTNYLLAAGERETVAQFFDTLSRGSTDAQRFANSAKAIRAGQMPDSYQRQMTAR